jgi:transposase InsO family protein
MRIFTLGVSGRRHGLIRSSCHWLRDIKRADKELVIKALDEEWNRRGKPSAVMFHSDQGSQYMSLKFRQRLWRCKML